MWWLGLFTFAGFYVGLSAFTLLGHNTPPVLNLYRSWWLPENETIGTKIETARATDTEEDSITFDIKPSSYLDGSEYFRIDPHTGAIYLNKSLSGKAGEQFYLYVTAKDEEFESKTEVFLEILPVGGRPKHLASKAGNNPPPVPPFHLNIPQPKHDRSRAPMPPVFQTPPQFQGIPVVHRPVGLLPSPPPAAPSSTSGTPRTVTETPVDKKHADDSPPVLAQVPQDISGQDSRPKPSYAAAPPGGGDRNGDANQHLDEEEEDAVLATESPSTTQEELSRNSAVAAAVAPIVALIGLVPLVAGGLWLVRRSRYLKNGMTSGDDKKRSENSTIVANSNLQESEFVTSSLPRAQSNKYETNEWDAGEKFSSPTQELSVQDSKWEYPRHHLKIFGILGEGCFGQVWKCDAQDIAGLPGITTVAVKTLKENAGDREKRDLQSELEILKILDPHPNIVRLYACCTEKDPLFVILEYVPHGKLQTYLRNSRADHYYGNLHGSSKHLTSKDLTSFAYHVARGMEYLTSKGIIHRDLAARNVLIGHNKTCKVADFGFARDVIANTVYERKSEGRLPIRWMAPESLYDNIFSSKTDVWSFGVLLWEIVTLGSTPYPGMAASEVIKKVRDGYRLEKPDHCKRELYNIMYYCWDKESRERPSFVELAQTLEKLLLEDVDYIELERFPDHAYYNVVSLSGEKV